VEPKKITGTILQRSIAVIESQDLVVPGQNGFDLADWQERWRDHWLNKFLQKQNENPESLYRTLKKLLVTFFSKEWAEFGKTSPDQKQFVWTDVLAAIKDYETKFGPAERSPSELLVAIRRWHQTKSCTIRYDTGILSPAFFNLECPDRTTNGVGAWQLTLPYISEERDDVDAPDWKNMKVRRTLISGTVRPADSVVRSQSDPGDH
jgi:hypothetical protein